MKILVTGTVLALTALAASPAFAKSYHARMSAAPAIASDAYAAAPGPAFVSSPPVIFDNKVVGQDPDPNVRLNLYRDPGLLAD